MSYNDVYILSITNMSWYQVIAANLKKKPKYCKYCKELILFKSE